MMRRSGIICGPIWGSFPVRGHLRFNLGIISGPGIICGPVQFDTQLDGQKIFTDNTYERTATRAHYKSLLDAQLVNSALLDLS